MTDNTTPGTTRRKISDESMRRLLAFQQGEIDEAEIYKRVATYQKDPRNREVLLRLSADEARHAHIWQGYTGRELPIRRAKVAWSVFIARFLGFTFAVKHMENNESGAQKLYDELAHEIPEAVEVKKDENEHEHELLGLLDEERLRYVGSMVLGLNDAMVELTGTLAGLTLAMQNTRVIALSGLITGIAATLSMASSEYLSSKSEGRPDALKSSTYTGIAYLLTVVALIIPYLLFPDDQYLFALGTMILIVIVILVVFNYYVSVAQDLPFRRRFLEMAGISLGVAALSFVIGLLVKMWLGVDI